MKKRILKKQIDNYKNFFKILDDNFNKHIPKNNENE